LQADEQPFSKRYGEALMGSQFIHYEDYAQKAVNFRKTTGFIFGEVKREASMSDHIANPKPPVVVYGASVEEAEQGHNDKAAGTTIQVKGGRQRKIRQDQKTLASIVISHPYLLEEAEQDSKMTAELRAYETNSINWLKDTFGDDLISVSRHDDEPHAHWHALIIPLSDPEFKASNLHPGKAAKAKVMQDPHLKKFDSKLRNKKGDMAYQEAMRAFQDSFYQMVSKPAGLTRLGPKGRRRTRSEWHLEKTQARALLEVMQEAEEYRVKRDKELSDARSEIAQLQMENNEFKTENAELKALIANTGAGVQPVAKGDETTSVIDDVAGLLAPDKQSSDVENIEEAQPDHAATADWAEPVDDQQSSEARPKLPTFQRPTFLRRQDNQSPRAIDQQAATDGASQSAIVNSEMQQTNAQKSRSSQYGHEAQIDDWEDEEEAKRKRAEHERFLDNKSFTFYDLCKSPDADILLRERAQAAADATNKVQKMPNGDQSATVSAVAKPGVGGGQEAPVVPRKTSQFDDLNESNLDNELSSSSNLPSSDARQSVEPNLSVQRTETVKNNERQLTAKASSGDITDGEQPRTGDVKTQHAVQRPAHPMRRADRKPEPIARIIPQPDTSDDATTISELKPRTEQKAAANLRDQPATDSRNHNVKKQPKTNEVEGKDTPSRAARFLNRLSTLRRKRRISADETTIEKTTSIPQDQRPAPSDQNSKPQTNVRYTPYYKVDNAKLGLPPGHDHLAGVRRKPKSSPVQKAGEDKPDYTPRPPSP
jgi:hypothetical protein